MAGDTYAGSFNITTGTADVSVSGVGFQPTAIVFTWNGHTAATSGIARGHAYVGFGFTAGVGSDRAATGYDEDNVATAQAGIAYRADCCVLQDQDGSLGRASLKSVNSDGFVLQIDDQFEVNFRVAYIALGGDINNAAVGTLSCPAATGTQDTTGLGFNPEAVLFIGMGRTTAPPVIETDVRLSFGMTSGTASGQNVTLGFGSNDNAASLQSDTYCISGECICTMEAEDPCNVAARATLNAWLTGGFQLNWTEVTSGDQVFYLALEGGDYLVGSLSTRTDTNDITESGFGWAPAGILFLSAFGAENSADTTETHGRVSIGVASSISDRYCHSYRGQDASDPMEIAEAYRNDAVYCNIAADETVQGLMDIKSLDGDGFTCVMDDTDPSAAFVGYIAFGPTAGATVSKNLQDTTTFSDQTDRDFWGDRLL